MTSKLSNRSKARALSAWRKAIPKAKTPGRAKVRKGIQVTKLIKQLEDHALGKLELRPTQVSAALGLLKKALPDLGKAAVTRDGKRPGKLVVAWRGVRG